MYISETAMFCKLNFSNNCVIVVYLFNMPNIEIKYLEEAKKTTKPVFCKLKQENNKHEKSLECGKYFI